MYFCKKYLILIILLPIFYVFSFILLSNYDAGDQLVYSNFFESLSSANVSDVMYLAKLHVSSVEPISAFTLWVGSNLGFDKNIFISLLNVVLLLGLFLLMWNHNAAWYVHFLLYTNFYILVLMTGAERLKIAYIFIIYSSIISNKLGVVFALISPFAHLQSLILLGGLAASKIVNKLKYIFNELRVNKQSLIVFCSFGLIVFFTLILLKDGVINKASYYVTQSGRISELRQLFLLLIIGLVVANNKFRMFVMLMSMTIPVYFLGGMRVNMIAVSLFIYIMIIERRTQNPLVLALLCYFSLKSMFFLRSVFIYGDGFHNLYF